MISTLKIKRDIIIDIMISSQCDFFKIHSVTLYLFNDILTFKLFYPFSFVISEQYSETFFLNSMTLGLSQLIYFRFNVCLLIIDDIRFCV
jgi:hypothetical protein